MSGSRIGCINKPCKKNPTRPIYRAHLCNFPAPSKYSILWTLEGGFLVVEGVVFCLIQVIVAQSTSVCPFAIIWVVFHAYPAFQVIKSWLWLFKTESKFHYNETAFHFPCAVEFIRVQWPLFLMEFMPGSLHNCTIYLFRMIPLLFLIYCLWQSFTFTVTTCFKSKEHFLHL